VTFLSPAGAARRLGVSAKALRLYEERGLLTPGRTPAGWRAYGPAEMQRAEEIAALRALGFSLAQVARVLGGDASGLEPALAARQSALEDRLRHLAAAIARVRNLRADLAAGATPAISDLLALQPPRIAAAFDLPWPWGGERFELADIRPLTWITGPLGSGKTKLAQRLAEMLPGAAFIGLDRTLAVTDAAHRARIGSALAWLAEDGAALSDALTILISHLEAESPAALVIDLVEHGLDEATQLALAAHLRHRGAGARPLFLMTRSSAMLDLAACGPDETIILCPANHSLPMILAPHPGSPGYEAAATCLAPPDVRARTEGVIAFRPPAA
jgi:DNA-binding transcriptional MerR regulator